MSQRKALTVLLVAIPLVFIAAATLASVQRFPSRLTAPPRPLTLGEKIATIKAITFDDIAPYLEVRFVFHPHTDGIVHARWCDDNNFDRLAKRPDGPMLVWLANQTTEKYIWQRTEETHFCYFLDGERSVGDSPWGAFTELPWLRELVEPLFEEAKDDYVEILQKLDADEGVKEDVAGPVAETRPM